MYVNFIPETQRNFPERTVGRPSQENYKACKRTEPGTSFTTKTLLMILEMMEYLNSPGGIIKSLRMLPEFRIQQSAS